MATRQRQAMDVTSGPLQQVLFTEPLDAALMLSSYCLTPLALLSHSGRTLRALLCSHSLNVYQILLPTKSADANRVQRLLLCIKPAGLENTQQSPAICIITGLAAMHVQ